MDATSAYAIASLSLLFISGFFGAIRVQYNEIKKHYDEMKDLILDEAKKTLTQKPESKAIKADHSEHEHVYRRVCYYIVHSAYEDQLPVKAIKPELCTHMVVGFGRIRNGLLTSERPKDLSIYKQVTALKSKDLKVLLSIGAITNGEFAEMVKLPATRLRRIFDSSSKVRGTDVSNLQVLLVLGRNGVDRFIHSSLSFCNVYGFDGLDFDWEFPSWKGSSYMEKMNFVYLLKEFREVLKKEQKEGFLLTAAVGAPLAIILSSYNIPELAEVADFVNLMSFDFHRYHPDRPYTGHHSPLFKGLGDQHYFATLNTAWAANFWAHHGMPRSKIVVGVPTFARTFHLVYPYGQTLIDTPADGPGLGNGMIPYYQVCKFLRDGAQRKFDVHAQVPYAYKGHNWISYEDEKSVSIKANWVVQNGFGGVMTFNLNNDDWKAACDNRTVFPLQRAIARAMG